MVESMKMQFEVAAPVSGRVVALVVASGQTVGASETLAVLEETAQR